MIQIRFLILGLAVYSILFPPYVIKVSSPEGEWIELLVKE